MAESVIITDGSVDFSGGVDSIKVTTIQSERNPNGLARNQLAWLNNAGVRDGGILPRWGWTLLQTCFPSSSLFQGAFLYKPLDANPYHIVSISGHIYKVEEGSPPVDLTGEFPSNSPQFNPADQPIAYFCQAEQYLIIQAGDGITLPFFWDGNLLRRSIGITTSTPANAPNINEIPAATAMDYFMGRIWYAQGRTASAGDIVGGPSGTVANEYRDSVLSVTECPLVLGGDGFSVPAEDGVIRGLAHSANIDAALGQGRLFMGTRKAIYALNVPVSRADWIATTNSNQPLVTVVQINTGWVNDRGIVTVNGDLFYQSLEPAIRSLNQSIRYFGQWGNKQISNNEHRILQYNNRELLRYCSGIYFNNRMYQTALPEIVDQGVIHKALIPCDFIPISSFGADHPPNWEGMYEGLDFLQVTTADFGGLERAFAFAVSRETSEIQLWELTSYAKDDNNAFGEARINWIIETPAFTWGDETTLKQLCGAELWIDRLYGTVQFSMEYRPDGQACWNLWHIWKKCSPRNSAENANNPISYPLTPCLESYFNSMTLPAPDPMKCASATGRPAIEAYQFQVRLVIKGFCRVRGIYLHATARGRKLYQNITC